MYEQNEKSSRRIKNVEKSLLFIVLIQKLVSTKNYLNKKYFKYFKITVLGKKRLFNYFYFINIKYHLQLKINLFMFIRSYSF